MKKNLRILMSEPMLFLAIPISLISLFLVIVLRPFVRIRIGFLRCDRIGHFAAETELYLCERDASGQAGETIDLFYYPRNLCNKQLAKMWERKIHILPWFLLRPMDLIIRSFTFLSPFKVIEAKGGVMDIDNLLDRLPTHLEFTQEEEERGQARLLEMGIPVGELFVCLVVRDSAYLAQKYEGADVSHHNYRDTDIRNYVLAAEALAERGYFVIRMGVKVNGALKSDHPMVIDYATNGMRSDFMDIYLGVKCAFCISTGTGWDAIPEMARRPIAYVNFVPLGYLHTYSAKNLSITKRFVSRATNENLTLRDIFSRGLGFSLLDGDYTCQGVDLVENTPEEILDLVVEMVGRLNGAWHEIEDDDMLQKAFWERFPVDTLAPGGSLIHGEIRSRYGAVFLRKNLWWLA